jgi:hypothetical protein
MMFREPTLESIQSLRNKYDVIQNKYYVIDTSIQGLDWRSKDPYFYTGSLPIK